MKQLRLLDLLLVACIVVLGALNIYQWARTQDVSARPAIVLAWSDEDGLFDDDALFEAFKKSVSSRAFIESVLEKPRYQSIRERFLADWNPEVTRTKVSDLYGKPDVLYWGRERRILSDLIADLYEAIRGELRHHRSLATKTSDGPEDT